MRLWLDDCRPPPDDSWLVARTADQAIQLIKEHRDSWTYASFDHDLGHCDKCEGCHGWRDQCGCRCHLTGYVVVVWCETEDIWPVNRPTCHSRNPVGKAKIEAAIKRKYG